MCFRAPERAGSTSLNHWPCTLSERDHVTPVCCVFGALQTPPPRISALAGISEPQRGPTGGGLIIGPARCAAFWVLPRRLPPGSAIWVLRRRLPPGSRLSMSFRSRREGRQVGIIIGLACGAAISVFPRRVPQDLGSCWGGLLRRRPLERGRPTAARDLSLAFGGKVCCDCSPHTHYTLDTTQTLHNIQYHTHPYITCHTQHTRMHTTHTYTLNT